jgi:hypothetical protein
MIHTTVVAFLIAGSLIALSSCARQARLYPVDEFTAANGIVKVKFMEYGSGNGEVVIVMPNEEVLKGEYSIVPCSQVRQDAGCPIARRSRC